MNNYDDWKYGNPQNFDLASDIYFWDKERLIAEYNFLERDDTAHITLVYGLALSANLATLEQDDTDVYELLKDTIIMEQAIEVMRDVIVDERMNSSSETH